MMTLLLALVTNGFAQAVNPADQWKNSTDEDCWDTAASMQADISNGRGSYSEDAQQAFLMNYFALATSLSPLHSAVPLEGGQGSIGLELDFIPALGCHRRLVLGATKTEDTNKAPIAPRPRVLFQFKDLGPFKIYAGLSYVPPVTVFGTRNVIVGGEAGFGLQYDDGFEWGMRYHATLMKTIAEIATPFNKDTQPTELDFYMGSTFGIDLIVGYDLPQVDGLKPYASLGFTDVSTFFYIGDNAHVTNNMDPYASVVGSLGAQYSMDRLEFAGEFYTAPGIIYTGRVRMGIKL